MPTALASSPRPRRLPTFIEPMLATLHAPFESDLHLYETKWDGFRSLAFIEGGKVRLVGRRGTDFTPRFPELIPSLKTLPTGTILDGEIIQLKNGLPDFQALLARERSFVSSKIPGPGKYARVRPVQFVAFDLLYERGKSVMSLPLFDRRPRLDKLLSKRVNDQLAISAAQIGGGLVLFDRINKLGMEGVMAKRLDAPYEPGARSGAWTKFKQRKTIPCIVIGYEPSTARGIKSLVVAAEVEGELRFVGQVGSGINDAMSSRLLRRFKRIEIEKPVVKAGVRHARWLKPELMCEVAFAEWTNDGRLRQPAFKGISEL